MVFEQPHWQDLYKIVIQLAWNIKKIIIRKKKLQEKLRNKSLKKNMKQSQKLRNKVQKVQKKIWIFFLKLSLNLRIFKFIPRDKHFRVNIL